MRRRFFFYTFSLLIILLTASCQGIKNSSIIVTPSFQPTHINPTKTLITPQVTNKPAYPPPNVSPYPIPLPIITFSPTPVPTIFPSPVVTTEPTLTPLPEFTQRVQPFYPKCNPESLYLQCYDDVLGIRFKYPSHWGVLNTELINGTCGGYFYSFRFYGSSEVSAGGSSVDYCKQMGGDLFTMFRGFKPGHGCDQFPQSQDCRQVNDNVVIATLFPDYQSICEPGPSSIPVPQMVVGINIPGNHIVSGVVFSVDFLSVKGTDKLLEPFGGTVTDISKCSDPNTEIQFNQLVEDISLKVRQGTFDEETSYMVKGIMDFANSITFSP